ncbi:SKAP protein, partial [Rhodinocichla rosea]|nr:SKAP protein [Rhodinocichla rosea]
ELQMNFPSKRKCVSKTSEPELSVVPSLHFASNVPADSVFKPANQGLPKSEKKVEPVSKKTVARRPLTRYQLEAELKNKNQLVETLKQQLARAEGTLKLRALKKENERLVHEVEKLKEIQETCMMILESRNINPGKELALCLHPGTPPEFFFPSVQSSDALGLVLSLPYSGVSKTWCALTSPQTAMAKWKSAQEENQHALEKHSYFQAQIKEWKAILEALGKLLAM